MAPAVAHGPTEGQAWRNAVPTSRDGRYGRPISWWVS
jgi:hypothetical protein